MTRSTAKSLHIYTVKPGFLKFGCTGGINMTTAASDNEQTAPGAQQAALRSLIKRLGEAGAAREVGISRSALLRAAGGFGVRSGTLALLREWSERAAS